MYHPANRYPGALFHNSTVKNDRARGKKTTSLDRCSSDMSVGANQDVVADVTRIPPGASNDSVLHNDAPLADPHRCPFSNDNGPCSDNGMRPNLDVPRNDGTLSDNSAGSDSRFRPPVFD
jgi:hypothetical protein